MSYEAAGRSPGFHSKLVRSIAVVAATLVFLHGNLASAKRISFQNGRLAEARRFYRRALHLGGDDAESYAAMGELAVVTGDLKTARKMLRKAQKLEQDNRRTVRLAIRMGMEQS